MLFEEQHKGMIISLDNDEESGIATNERMNTCTCTPKLSSSITAGY